MADTVVKVFENRTEVIVAGSELLRPLIDRKVQNAADLLAAQTAADRAAAEAAALQTANDRQEIEEIASGAPDAPSILSRELAIDATVDVDDRVISSAYSYIRTAGYEAAGDGGGALFRRVASEPSHPGKRQSQDGAWWEIAEKEIDARMVGLKVGVGQGDQQPAIMAAIEVALALGHRNVYLPTAPVDNPIEIGQTIRVLDRVNIRADGYRACVLQKIADGIGLVVGPNVAARDCRIGTFMIRGRQDDGDLRDGIYNPDENSPGAIFYEKGYYDVHCTLNGGPNWQGDPEYAAFMETVAPGKTIVPVMHSAGQFVIPESDGLLASTCFQIGLIQSIRGSEGKQGTSLNGTILKGRANYGYGDGVFTGWEVGTEDSTYQIAEGRRNINGVVIELEDGKNLVNGRIVNWTRGFKSRVTIDIAEGNDCISVVRFDDDYIEARVNYLAGGQDYSFEFGPAAAFCEAYTLHDNGTVFFDAATSESNVAYQGINEYKKSAASLTRVNKGYERVEGGIQIGTSILKQFENGRSLHDMVWSNGSGAALTPTTNTHDFQHDGRYAGLWFNMVWTRSGSFANNLRLSSLPRAKLGDISALPQPHPIGVAWLTTGGVTQLVIPCMTTGDRIEFYKTDGTVIKINDVVADGAEMRIHGSVSYPLNAES